MTVPLDLRSSGVPGLRARFRAAPDFQHMLAGVAQYANFRFADSFYRYEYGTSFVYWSLSLEEQFYLLFPLMIVLFRKHLVWALLALVAVQLFTLRTPIR